MKTGMPEKPPTVLLVDDETVALRVLSSALRTFLGWEVITAVGPIAAAALYEKADIVVTDWIMPNGGGARVLDECKKPVLVVSSAEHINYPYRIDKPVSVQSLAQAIENLLFLSKQQ
ncbi:MAG: hypothetical protein JW841_07745 [Deltaproteobacteria bacterium]|nr:hypothetical protein [Deltaproteobacteria bacterium]